MYSRAERTVPSIKGLLLYTIILIAILPDPLYSMPSANISVKSNPLKAKRLSDMERLKMKNEKILDKIYPNPTSYKDGTTSLDANKFGKAAKATLAARKINSLPPAGKPKEIKPVIVMRHRLRDCISFWKSFCSSVLILGWIEKGFDLKWNENGPPVNKSFDNHRSAFEHGQFVNDTIEELILAESIRRVKNKPRVVSPLGCGCAT